MEQERTNLAVEEFLRASSVEDCIRVVVDAWAVAHGSETPDNDPAQIRAELAEKFHHMPHDVVEDAHSRLHHMYKGLAARFEVRRVGNTMATDLPQPTRGGEDSGGQSRSRCKLVVAIPPGNGATVGVRVLSLGDFVVEYQDALRQGWENREEALPFPLAPLCHWLLTGPEQVESNDRADVLGHGAVLPSRKTASDHLVVVPPNQPFGYLPQLAPGEVDGESVERHSLPLELWDWRVRDENERGRGAPLAGRMFVEAVLDVHRDAWSVSAHRGVLLPPQRLGNYLVRLYGPDGAKNWDKRRLPTLRRAFAVLEATETRVFWRDPQTGARGHRRIVIPVDIPWDGGLDEFVRFAVFLPPLQKLAGPLIDRPALQVSGRKSAPAWRLVLMLSAHWYHPGALRIRLARGTKWTQVKTWDRYDVITDQQLVVMAFPQDASGISNSTLRSRKRRAKAALAYLATPPPDGLGFAEVLDEGRGKRRIRPGPNWVGWRGHPPEPDLGAEPTAAAEEDVRRRPLEATPGAGERKGESQ